MKTTKVKPPRGYRLMRPMERPHSGKGDIVFVRFFKWGPTYGTGERRVRDLMDGQLIKAYARKIDKRKK